MSTEFKATKENLLKLVESANNTDAGDGQFIVVGEPMPINEHPLRDEIFAKIDSGEVVFS